LDSCPDDFFGQSVDEIIKITILCSAGLSTAALSGLSAGLPGRQKEAGGQGGLSQWKNVSDSLRKSRKSASWQYELHILDSRVVPFLKNRRLAEACAYLRFSAEADKGMLPSVRTVLNTGIPAAGNTDSRKQK